MIRISIFITLLSCACVPKQNGKGEQYFSTKKAEVQPTGDPSKDQTERDTISFLQENDSVFFSLFPSTFAEFDELFGYTRVKKDSFVSVYEYGPLYKHMDSYVNRFFGLQIANRAILNRVISILILADAHKENVASLASNTLDFIKKDMETTISLLAEHNDEEVYDFWRGLFYSDHPENYEPEFSTLFAQVSPMNARVAHLMNRAYQDLLSSSGHEH